VVSNNTVDPETFMQVDDTMILMMMKKGGGASRLGVLLLDFPTHRFGRRTTLFAGRKEPRRFQGRKMIGDRRIPVSTTEILHLSSLARQMMKYSFRFFACGRYPRTSLDVRWKRHVIKGVARDGEAEDHRVGSADRDVIAPMPAPGYRSMGREMPTAITSLQRRLASGWFSTMTFPAPVSRFTFIYCRFYCRTVHDLAHSLRRLGGWELKISPAIPWFWLSS
jgi:hypothetical protein